MFHPQYLRFFNVMWSKIRIVKYSGFPPMTERESKGR